MPQTAIRLALDKLLFQAMDVSKKERFMAKLEELWREYRAPVRGQELVQSRLRWEDWEGLRKEAVEAAKVEIRRRRWRGARGGVLPDGYDAEGIANQVIEEMLGGHCKLAIGWTRERLVKELQRLVSQRVRVLHGRKEAASVRNEWDATRVKEGERRVSAFAKVAGNERSAYEALAEKEDAAEMREKIEAFLKEEPVLKGIFECLWAGITKPAEIGRELGMEKGEVMKARRRLDRRLARLGKEVNGR